MNAHVHPTFATILSSYSLARPTTDEKADDRAEAIGEKARALVAARLAAIKDGDAEQVMTLVASLLDRLEDYDTLASLVERLALAGADSLVRDVMHAEAVLEIEAN